MVEEALCQGAPLQRTPQEVVKSYNVPEEGSYPVLPVTEEEAASQRVLLQMIPQVRDAHAIEF